MQQIYLFIILLLLLLIRYLLGKVAPGRDIVPYFDIYTPPIVNNVTPTVCTTPIVPDKIVLHT